MKNPIIILLLFLGFFADAQNWENLVFDEDIPGIEANPLKGFVDLFVPENDFPRSINAKLFRMDSLMFGIDDFKWDQIDTFLAHSAEEGNHTYFQINIDPGFGETYMPTFLDGLVEFENYTEGAVPDLCPDWNNPYLMEAMLNFIDSLGARYNDDSRVFMVHLGLYGIFGEWHIGDVENVRPEFAMTPENKILIANAYKNAFPDKFLLARYPENMPNSQEFGYSDGLFFTQSISDNSFNNGYFHYTMRAYNADHNWKTLPIGGEIDPCIQDTLWKSWPNITSIDCGDPPQSTDIQNVEESLDSIHPTWLFSHHVFTAIGDNTTDEWANAIKAQKLMGYTFYTNEYRLSATNQKPTIEVNIQNRGLAPMYANWYIEFGSINTSDEFQSLGRTKWNLHLIQPDGLDNYRAFTSDTALVDGTYEFLYRIVNPLDSISVNAKKVRFANETQDASMTGWLSLGDETITSGNAGVTPVSVINVSISQNSVSMVVGESISLSATVNPINATNQNITWVSDQPRTASVNANGQVSAGPTYGNARITAYTQDGNYMATCDISVSPNRVNIPALIEAEDFIRMSGVVVEGSGQQNLGFIDDRDWMEYGVIVSSASIFTADYVYANKYVDSEISIVDSAGNVLDFLFLPKTGEWFDYDTLTSNPIMLLPGEYNLRLEAKQGGFNLDWIEFKSDTPLLSSYTFLGTTDDQFIDGSNWDGGMRPPNGYNGLVTIQADCVLPEDMTFLLNPSAQLIIASNVVFEIR